MALMSEKQIDEIFGLFISISKKAADFHPCPRSSLVAAQKRLGVLPPLLLTNPAV